MSKKFVILAMAFIILSSTIGLSGCSTVREWVPDTVPSDLATSPEPWDVDEDEKKE